MITERQRKQDVYAALAQRYSSVAPNTAVARKLTSHAYYRMFGEPSYRAFLPAALEFAQAPADIIADLFKLKPKEAAEYLRAKGYALTTSHDEMRAEAHRKAFTVAKATKMDMLVAIREQLQKAIDDGTSLHDFKKELTPKLEKQGFFGKREITKADGTTEIANVLPSRLNTIFRNNVQSAYNAGRIKQMDQTVDRFPYREYLPVVDDSTTDVCLKFNGKVFHHTDPILKRYRPPLHHGCRTTIRSLSEKSLIRSGKALQYGKDYEDANDETHSQGFNFVGDEEWQPDFKKYDNDIATAAKAEIEAYVPPLPTEVPDEWDPVAEQKKADEAYKKLLKQKDIEGIGNLGEMLSSAERLAKLQNIQFGSMDARDIGMVRKYTGNLYKKLNESLLNSDGTGAGWAAEMKVALNNALMKGPKHESAKPLHRGITLEPDQLEALLSKNTVGSVQKFDAFTSTSVSEKVAKDFGNVRFRIANHSGKGVNVAKLSIFEEEKEVMLPAGTKYKVTKVTKGKFGAAIIDVELL